MISDVLVVLPNQLFRSIYQFKKKKSKSKSKSKPKRLKSNDDSNSQFKAAKDNTQGDGTNLLDLPTEILCLIFDNLLLISKKRSDLVRITPTCRRFRHVLLPYIYTDCNVLFEHSYNETISGCVYRRDKFELYRLNGHIVRKLSITTDQNIYHNSVTRINQFKNNPPLPSIIGNLIPNFSNLKIAEFEGKVESRVSDLIDAIEVVITNCLTLKQLNIKIHTRRDRDLLSPYQKLKFLRSKKPATPTENHSEEQCCDSSATEDVAIKSYARLEILNIGIREYATGPYYNSSLNNENPCMLEILSQVLAPSFRTVKRLQFHQIQDTQPVCEYLDSRTTTSTNEYGPPRTLELPNLECLDIQCTRKVLTPFDKYVRIDYDKVRELRIGMDLRSNVQIPEFLSRFPNIESLQVDNVQPFTTVRKRGYRVWLPRPWDYLRDKMILPRINSLKKVTVVNTLDTESMVSEQLGAEFVSGFRIASVRKGKDPASGKEEVSVYSVSLEIL
ncbi:hypothetical protein AA313_de0207854 [Arthrobotrys entomopaga]|nr:hypothetical protein AA313_de0207854 [Arthrobotrys entomopaga]